MSSTSEYHDDQLSTLFATFGSKLGDFPLQWPEDIPDESTMWDDNEYTSSPSSPITPDAVVGDPFAMVESSVDAKRSDLIHPFQERVRAMLSTQALKRIAILCVLHGLTAGNPHNIHALCYTSSLLGVSLESVTEWYQEFERDPDKFLMGSPKSASSSHSTHNRVAKRTWLLEEYPELHLKAQRWVKKNMKESLAKDNKLFRIIDFQNWVNSELLVDLFKNPSTNVIPISHSTARSWLGRFGYYDKLNELESKHGSQQPQRMSPRTLAKQNATKTAAAGGPQRRKRANTWAASTTMPDIREIETTMSSSGSSCNMDPSEMHLFDFSGVSSIDPSNLSLRNSDD